MAIKFLSSGNVTGGLTLSGALSGTSATFTGDITARIGNFKSPDASESIIMNLAANNGNNAATFRTTASGSIFEIRSENSGTIKIDSPTTTFTGNVIIDGTATIGGSDVITRSGTTAQGRLAIWQNDSAIKGDNNLFYASQYLTIGVGTTGGFAALRINAATVGETYLDFTEGATFTKRAQIQVDTNDNMYFRNTSNNTLALTIDSSQNALFKSSVGIGTPLAGETYPRQLLDIRESSGTDYPKILVKYDNNTGSTTAPTASLLLSPGQFSSDDTAPRIVGYRTADFSSAAARSAGLILGVSQNNAAKEALRITESGLTIFKSSFVAAGSYGGELNIGGSSVTTFGLQAKYNQAGATQSTLYSSPGYTSNDQLFLLGAGAGNTAQLVLRGNGNVGIGTTSPDTKLHIYGSSTVSEMYLGEDAAVDKAGILKYNQGDGTGTGSVQLGNWGDTLNTTGVTIKKGGNVGIGTSTPAGKFEIKSAASNWTTAPAITFTDDTGVADSRWILGNIATNYGNFVLAESDSATTVNYSPRITVIPGGNVGIGVTSPGARLELDNPSAFTNMIEYGNVAWNQSTGHGLVAVNRGSDGYVQLQITSGVDNADVFTIRNSGTGANIQHNFLSNGNAYHAGNVGIGTTSPSQQLELGGIASPALKLTSTSTNGGVIIFNVAGADKGFFGSGYHLGTGSSNDTAMRGESDLVFLSGGNNQRMRIESTGVVKFPNTAASTGDVGTIAHYTNNYMYIRGGTSGLAIGDDGFGVSVYLNNSDSIQFNTGNGTEKMRITSGGFTKAKANGGNYFNGSYHEFLNNNNVSGDRVMVIGNTAGSATNNTSSIAFTVADNANDRLKIFGNGNVVNINNSYGSSSDIKLKENIVNATPKLDDLMKVKIRNYNFIGDDKKQIGVVAQELEGIFPNMIDEIIDYEYKKITDKEGNITEENIDLGTTTKSVKYSVFVPMLIKAIQELTAKVEMLEKK